jgi:prepilin-type N-terminal cleavage/methylation domain-containing protein
MLRKMADRGSALQWRGAVLPKGWTMGRQGITLIEMLIVVALLSLMVGVTFPSVSSGIDSLRIISASDAIVSFLNGALNRAERRQEVVEVEVSVLEDLLTLRSADPGFVRRLELPDGVTIRTVLPRIPVDPEAPRRFLLYPGGTVPRFGIELVNRRGARRIVRVDPITGAPQVELLEAQ